MNDETKRLMLMADIEMLRVAAAKMGLDATSTEERFLCLGQVVALKLVTYMLQHGVGPVEATRAVNAEVDALKPTKQGAMA